MRTTILAALLVASMGACTASGPASDAGADGAAPLGPRPIPDGLAEMCAQATVCGDCTMRVGCGWCQDRCLAGDERGSFDATCSGDAWSYRTIACDRTRGAHCGMHTDCMSCAMDHGGCGWCANVGRCVAGEHGGPAQFIEGCTRHGDPPTWIYNLDRMQCP